MAAKTQLKVYTMYYESFLALSVSIRVDKHQLVIVTHKGQAPVLQYRRITITTVDLKESLSAVCPVLGVHNVARVRLGASLPLVEVDFTDEKALEKFCKSIADGNICKRLQQQLKGKIHGDHEIDVSFKLHLFMPSADKSAVSREVTTANYQKCFSLVRESVLLNFKSFDITHDAVMEDDSDQELSINDLSELLKELEEVAAHWFTVGVFLKIAYYKLVIIRKKYHDQNECLTEMLAIWLEGTDASPEALVQALRSAGMAVLAKKIADKHGLPTGKIAKSTTEESALDTSSLQSTEDLIKVFEPFRMSDAQASQAQSDISALACQRQRIATDDIKHSALDEQLRELGDSEENVTESFEQTKSSLESLKSLIDQLKHKQESLIEKRESKRSSKLFLVRLRSSNTGEELAQINQMIKDTEEAVEDLSNQINELKATINFQNEKVAEMSDLLVQKEREKKQLEEEMKEVQKEKSSLESKLEEERRKFEKELQRMIDEQRQNEEMRRKMETKPKPKRKSQEELKKTPRISEQSSEEESEKEQQEEKGSEQMISKESSEEEDETNHQEEKGSEQMISKKNKSEEKKHWRTYMYLCVFVFMILGVFLCCYVLIV